ncbi:DNA repair ATPase [Flavobacteriaceae bacterium TK19130]|nr:DNA repair ATPase [Thermobacterium salinum]
MASTSDEQKVQQNPTLDGGTYEIIQNRLQKQKQTLQNRLQALNDERKTVFGSLETKLVANDRINTENNCIARDIVSLGNTCLFGYNVHFGLRTDITLDDVFSLYRFKDNRFEPLPMEMLQDETFITDFTNLYKYYRNTIFSKFSIIGNYLYMVFQLSESTSDIKTFKWLIKDDSLSYVDNRSDHEYTFPAQHEFNWQEVTRDMHRYGVHPHVSILDKVFVETVGGDLTIKIEDNTEDGKGIFSEGVEHKDQTLDDGQYRYANLGNLVVLEIKPFQEPPRYFVYNHKIKEVQKIESIKDTCVLLPDDQGIIFPTGYYLQTGEYSIFDNAIPNVQFQEKIVSPNGEDFLYVFYAPDKSLYNLMAYNVISQEIKTPIICNGFTILEQGELCYFKTEAEQTKHHVIQIWQTPFLKGDYMPSQHEDSLLYKIGNKDIVKAMAEINGLITLLNKEDSYQSLYSDIAKFSKDILDAYYWLPEPETKKLNEPLGEINDAANAAIEEFEKVQQLKKKAKNASQEVSKKVEDLFGKIKSTSFRSIQEYVQALSKLRGVRGETISLKDIRYVEISFAESLEEEIATQTERISERCVQFLLNPKALQPYQDAVAEKEKMLQKVSKVTEAKKLEAEINEIAEGLEMLIDIVSNLSIEDTAQSTKIIDDISLIFASINQLKASLKNKRKSLVKAEAEADFAAQLKLIDQSIINYLDMAATPEKCDEFQNKISVQLEELEGKFADFEAFIEVIIEKREEVYAAFEAQKNALVEKRNKKAVAFESAATRILNGVQKKAERFTTGAEVNGYFASDLMVNKVRDIIQKLREMEDSGKAEAIETKLKTAREEALRKLKDKNELYEDGENVIRLGSHKFGVNRQPLDLTIVHKKEGLQAHLTGTDYYESITDETLLESADLWEQEYISENKAVYRGAYLAYKAFAKVSNEDTLHHNDGELLQFVQNLSRESYAEGYIKGVHDHDATAILQVLIQKHLDLGLLKFHPEIRANAQFFWHGMKAQHRGILDRAIKASGVVIQCFPNSAEYDYIIEKICRQIEVFLQEAPLFDVVMTKNIAQYIFEELQGDATFIQSAEAGTLSDNFQKALKKQQADIKFKKGYEEASSYEAKIRLVRQWVSAYIKSTSATENLATHRKYIDEVVCAIIFEDASVSATKNASPTATIKNLKGSHETIKEGAFQFDYHEFMNSMAIFLGEKVPAFEHFRKTKHAVIEQMKKNLKLEEFKPRVLTSFVRNKLIDQVYLPLIGDNLSKQLGTVGDAKRTDRMGMLLLISPPGYGKTTLMEYIANRLGLVFVKINGPAIGHEVTSVDPMAATNSAAREELKRLNLAFEMGNNVMLYLDDIQHCSPEFLQKFISLSDGTRKIEGVHKGESKTYDLRGKKFCVVMAGNPYTESGEKFQIPDMLANRADIYNLGDIIGDTEHLFKLSLVENALTSNPLMHQLSSVHFEDFYTLLDRVENHTADGQLLGNYSSQEVKDYESVLEKIVMVRETVLAVNKTYIKSAAMEDAYRTEPPFKLQGSYRDMNKLVAKVVPIMNTKEIDTLLLSHYESEAQTLNASAEANLLKFRELRGTLTAEEKERWESIKETFEKNNKLKGLGDKNEMAQLLLQMMEFSTNLEGIRSVLEKGLDRN